MNVSKSGAACTQALLSILLVLLSACSSAVNHLRDQALGYGFQPLESQAAGFTLTSFRRLPPNDEKRLHIYLEGDGRPWEQGLFPAVEPTTRSSTMLPLMALDSAPAIYLGRPCYNGHAADSGCSATLWTSARYGAQVVDAMTLALRDFCREHHYNELVLIGHSGGGSLALLLAERLPQTVAVVTLAANYDIDAWADHHGYQRLRDSLNPATQTQSGVPEWHLLGTRDRNIPPDLFQQALSRRQFSTVELVEADHNHGWEQFWPQMLARLKQLR